MTARALLAGLALSLALWAQMQLTVDQLVSFVKSSVELKQPDKKVADYLRKVQLSQKLEDKTIDDLLASGIGPKTLDVLRELQTQSKNLTPPASPAQQAKHTIPPPSEEEQKRILGEVRDYALNYTKNLPDFLCLQVTRRYLDPSGLEFWQRHDEITTRLSYVDNHEDYKVIMVNNTATDISYEKLDGATSTGEFGTMMKEIFDPESEATFQWARWATLRGKRAHVYSYHVSKARSKWSILWQRQLSITPAYSGLIYVDSDTQMVLRITLEAVDIPGTFPIQQASQLLDYDYTMIGARDYLLPMRAQMRMREGKMLVKNEVEFRKYKKFSADAVITFDTSTPAPLATDKTEEKGPQQ